MNRKHLTVLLSVLCVFAAVLVFRKYENKTPNEEASAYVESEESEEQKALFHRERLKYEFDMVKDPKTGKIPLNIYEIEMAQARTIPERTKDPISAYNNTRVNILNAYIPAGPNNIGGRTRALVYDVRYGTTNQV